MIQYIVINRTVFVAVYELYFLYCHVNQMTVFKYLNVTFNFFKKKKSF